jgi:integrase
MDHEEEMKALRARNAELEAKLEPLRAAAEARAAAEQLRRENEALENEVRDAPAIAAAVQEHGPIGTKTALVETSMGTIVVKRPQHLVWKKYTQKDKVTPDDVERLIRSCLVYPDKARFDEIWETLPGVGARLIDAVGELAGLMGRDRSGK